MPEREDIRRRVLGGGEEPDPRFSLANERTFLAWTRTSLALLAGGIAVGALPSEFLPGTSRLPLSVALLALGVVTAVSAAARWLKVERALRHRRPLPLPGLLPAVSAGVALGALAAAVIFLASGLGS